METVSKYEHRKVRKVLMERKRRDRIERCIDQLKTLIFGIQQQQQQQLISTCGNASMIDAKLEKAELLELTVEQVHRFRRDSSSSSSQMSLGFLTCMREVHQFLQNETGCDTGMRTQLFRRLHRSVVELGQGQGQDHDQGHNFEGRGHGLECRNGDGGFKGKYQSHGAEGSGQIHGFEGGGQSRGFEGDLFQCTSEGVAQCRRHSSLLVQLQEEHCSSQWYDSSSMPTDSFTPDLPKHHMTSLNSTNSSSSSSRQRRHGRDHPYIAALVTNNSLLSRKSITSTNSFESQALLPCLKISSSSSSSLKPEVVEQTIFRCSEISSTTTSGNIVTETEASAIARNDDKKLPVYSLCHDGSDVWRPW